MFSTSKLFRIVGLSLVFLVACTNSQYQTVQTGPDTVYASGNDPNVVKSNAYKACRGINDKYTDYSVLNADKTSINVRCEKSFLTRTEEAIDGVKHRINEWRNDNINK